MSDKLFCCENCVKYINRLAGTLERMVCLESAYVCEGFECDKRLLRDMDVVYVMRFDKRDVWDLLRLVKKQQDEIDALMSDLDTYMYK